MAQIRFYLDARRLKTDGTAPLKLAVTHRKGARYLPLDIDIRPDQWDKKRGEITTSHPSHRTLNLFLTRARLRAEEAVVSVVLSGTPYTLADLYEAVCAAVRPDKVAPAPKEPADLLVPLFKKFIATKSRPNTRASYATTLAKVEAFCKKPGALRFSDVTRSWLLGFDAFLSQTAKSPNARAVYMRNLRAVFNFAIDEGVTTCYPFRKFKIKTVKTAKRSLSVEDLRRLITMEVEPWQEQYRDYFLLTFLLIGINGVDLLGADHRAIVGGRLEYNRSKTSRLYSIKIEPEAAVLLDKYRGERHLLRCMDTCGNYINYLHRANEAMQAVGEVTRSGRGGKKSVVAAFPKISTYWMRHSWATVAAYLDIPKETIAAALGHGSQTVTDIYIDFDTKKIDEANRRVIDFVLYNKV